MKVLKRTMKFSQVVILMLVYQWTMLEYMGLIEAHT